MEMQQWLPQETESVTTEMLDQAVAKIRQLRSHYEAKKQEATNAHNELEEAENVVANLLKASGKTKYEAEGVGLAYLVTKETYTVPKSTDAKQKLFEYITKKYGRDTLMQMVGINFQTLNSWAKKELEADPLIEIPGLDQPTAEAILHFRKKD